MSRTQPSLGRAAYAPRAWSVTSSEAGARLRPVGSARQGARRWWADPGNPGRRIRRPAPEGVPQRASGNRTHRRDSPPGSATASARCPRTSRRSCGRRPAELGLGARRVGVRLGDVARPPRPDLVGQLVTAGPLERVHHLQHRRCRGRCRGSRSRPASSVAAEPVERGDVAGGEVLDVDVVAHAGAVGVSGSRRRRSSASRGGRPRPAR